jgi:hypothetical protein
VRCVAGWSVLRDIATTLGWSGALGESVGAWFGVLFVGAPNGRRADGDVTDHRPPDAFAPPARVARGVTALRRSARGASRLRHFVAGPGPATALRRVAGRVRGGFDVHVTFKPTRISRAKSGASDGE